MGFGVWADWCRLGTAWTMSVRAQTRMSSFPSAGFLLTASVSFLFLRSLPWGATAFEPSGAPGSRTRWHYRPIGAQTFGQIWSVGHPTNLEVCVCVCGFFWLPVYILQLEAWRQT